MNEKIVMRTRAWPTGVAALLLAAGCARAPSVADEPEGVESIQEGKESRRVDGAAGAAQPRAREDREAAPRPEEYVEDEPASEAEGKNEAKEMESLPAVPSELDSGGGDGGELQIETAPDASEAQDAAVTSVEDAGVAEAERVTCGSVSIRSRVDVEKYRACGEIAGDLRISSVGLTAITADDFPNLTTIAGDLTISGLQTNDAPHLESVTLASLQVVKGAVLVVGTAVPEFGRSGPLKELHLPALARVDGLGIAVFQASLKVLDLPALTTVAGSVLLDTLFDLCTINAHNIERIGEQLTVSYVPGLPSAALEALRSAAEGPVNERLLGCCAANPESQVACDGFTERARSLYCNGC